MIIIPVFSKSSARYTLSIELDTVNYQLNFSWNSREGFWYMDILDIAQNILKAGVKLVSEYSLFDQYMANGMPPGKMVVLNLANDETIPMGFDNFGSQYQLVYYTANEILTGIITQG